MKYEKEFRAAHPETVGESDGWFDISNYAEWLEDSFIASEVDRVIEERMPSEITRMREAVSEYDRKKWAEKSKRAREIMDKYFAEHTREEIMADLGMKDTFIQKIKYWIHSRLTKDGVISSQKTE